MSFDWFLNGYCYYFYLAYCCGCNCVKSIFFMHYFRTWAYHTPSWFSNRDNNDIIPRRFLFKISILSRLLTLQLERIHQNNIIIIINNWLSLSIQIKLSVWQKKLWKLHFGLSQPTKSFYKPLFALFNCDFPMGTEELNSIGMRAFAMKKEWHILL